MDWLKLLSDCGVKPATARSWAPVFAGVCTPERFSLGPAEMDEFLGNVLHESALLERLTENLNYSAQRLMAVWPTRFPTLVYAQQFAFNPEALANKVYGGRLGNIAAGDGWKYRGRGLMQVTGRANYESLARVMGLPLLDQPELLEQPENALLAAIVWWEQHVPDAFIRDPQKVRQAVNGGTLGLQETIRLASIARAALG